MRGSGMGLLREGGWWGGAGWWLMRVERAIYKNFCGTLDFPLLDIFFLNFFFLVWV